MSIMVDYARSMCIIIMIYQHKSLRSLVCCISPCGFACNGYVCAAPPAAISATVARFLTVFARSSLAEQSIPRAAPSMAVEWQGRVEDGSKMGKMVIC